MLEVVAVGFIVGASVFVNLMPPFIFKLSAKAAVGVDCPINTLPSLSTVKPSADPSPDINAVPPTKSILYVVLSAALRISMFASALDIEAAIVIAPAALVIVTPVPAVSVATDG